MWSPELVAQTVDAVFGLLERFGDADYIGEAISQMEHACQAAQMAEAEGFDDEVILAALFHDIGHLCALQDDPPQMDGYGSMEHEKLGSGYLRSRGFSSKITRLVESHVAAKRYLCFVDPEYYGSLSMASKRTLVYQGGPMNAKEAMEFCNDPLYSTIIRMRQWDEMAKKEGMPLIDLSIFREMAVKHLLEQRNAVASA
ncbi:MAG: HDIG domain-containing protein [Flavobacteriales bacterium]|nr:HDIG domain-containing protein [Flavobacteriales bacterium]